MGVVYILSHKASYISSFTIKRYLKNELILHLTQESEHSRLHVLEWIDRNFDDIGETATNKNKGTNKLPDELLFAYWKKAQSIIEDFNCYGGGPEEDEEEAYEWLSKISDLVNEDRISKEAKFKFLDADTFA